MLGQWLSMPHRFIDSNKDQGPIKSVLTGLLVPLTFPMPRIPNSNRRSHEDGKTAGLSQRARPVAHERKTVSFLLPPEERSPEPMLWFSSPDRHQVERQRKERTPTRSSAVVSTSTVHGNKSSSGRDSVYHLNSSPSAPAHHGTPSPRRSNYLSPLAPTNTNILSASTRPSAPRDRSTDYSEAPLTPMFHRVVLDKALTVPFNLRWDIRDHITRAKDRHDHPVDLDREAGLPTRIKLAVIEFKSSKHAWLVKRWGPIIVNNQFSAITIGNILSSVSGYLRETIRDGELGELILTLEDKARLDEAWSARHQNTFHRVHHDVPGVYRRLDVMRGEMYFEKISLRWVGEWACHISLSLTK